MRRLFLTALLLLPTLALADVDARFAQLRDQAEALGSLSSFLDKYIGECAGLFVNPSCKSNAEAFRAKYGGRKLYMIVGEDAATMLTPGPYQPGSGNYTIQVLPYFPGDAYALTQGMPTQTDSAGNPLLPLIRITGTTPEGWAATDFLRLFSSKKIRAQIVFTPQGVWTIPRKQGGKAQGVAARIEAILLTFAPTGDPLGLWFADQPTAAPKEPASKGGKKGKKK
ncbi:hypothetical protein BO221_22835 [Archangium sp. Cb G35]|uniref:DUF6066 family protein n=1 Tax=Archangium sp. Cb G35 TaxID=1920190 RepID=UPI000937B000|nr:DUF6066 family protein [Archangium sp. Cb G35]OJT22601.1 hypothetical protein BO221_22835 [Archangium sp. Cb G35]WNG58645.1 hypothetical protein F0U59_30840 [Archangium gephyra]